MVVRSPLLHDMIRAFLTYDAEVAKRWLALRHRSWRVFGDEYQLVAWAIEVPFTSIMDERARFADVVWLLKREEIVFDHIAIVFEIKTERFREDWFEQLRDLRRFMMKTDVFGMILRGALVGSPRHIVVLIAWHRDLTEFVEKSRYAEAPFGGTMHEYVRTGWIRLLELEELLPFIRTRLKKLMEVLC